MKKSPSSPRTSQKNIKLEESQQVKQHHDILEQKWVASNPMVSPPSPIPGTSTVLDSGDLFQPPARSGVTAHVISSEDKENLTAPHPREKEAIVPEDIQSVKRKTLEPDVDQLHLVNNDGIGSTVKPGLCSNALSLVQQNYLPELHDNSTGVILDEEENNGTVYLNPIPHNINNQHQSG